MAYGAKVKTYERQNVPRPGNPAASEAWALLEAARRIAGVVQFGRFDDAVDRKKIRDALRLNLRVWTIIQAEQTTQEADGGTPESQEIRRNILTLCKFIDQHSLDAMIEPTPERLAVLININRNIAAGLMGSVSDDDMAEAAAGGTPDGPSADERAALESIKTSV
jgi:flagellar protein FlaF